MCFLPLEFFSSFNNYEILYERSPNHQARTVHAYMFPVKQSLRRGQLVTNTDEMLRSLIFYHEEERKKMDSTPCVLQDSPAHHLDTY